MMQSLFKDFMKTLLCVSFFYNLCTPTPDLPQNEVVLAGRGVLLNCAQVQAYRWYRNLETDLWDDKVIYMGSRMADDADKRFRVYTKPDKYPYERLDLYISDVQANMFGTYKCLQPSTAHCADIIVLNSEPVCDVHLVRKYGVLVENAELTCSIKITSNADPQMLCNQDAIGTQTQSSCSKRHDGLVTCTTEVSLEVLPTTTCIIQFNPKPLQKYTTCLHASNQPSYSYKWIPSSDELLQSYTTQFWLIVSLGASIVVCILTWVAVLISRWRHAVMSRLVTVPSSLPDHWLMAYKPLWVSALTGVTKPTKRVESQAMLGQERVNV